jgi:hypothetical protein
MDHSSNWSDHVELGCLAAAKQVKPKPSACSGESGEGTNAESDRAILRSLGRFGLASRESLDLCTIINQPIAFDLPNVLHKSRECEPMPDTSREPPRKVALFSGHMIDAPSRKKPRFPPDKEPIAEAAIAEAVADLGLGPVDLAICGGACGGDLLFAEAVLTRGGRLELYIPFDEPTFLEKSVDFADRDWRARYFAAREPAVLHIAPSELGPIRDAEDPYERNNRWMLDSALRFGADKVDFVCLWNGESGDGPGGTRHMVDEVRNRGGRTRWLDTTKLWG